MQAELAIASDGSVAEEAGRWHLLPRWIRSVDSCVLALLNFALLIEIAIVFCNMMLRAVTGYAPFHGLEDTSRLLLIMLAFLGGAVAYGRGDFMSITFFVERASPQLQAFYGSTVEWVVIMVALAIGGYTIPLQLGNAGEKTTILGIDYIWLTLPMMIGTALFILHAGLLLLRRPPAAILMAGASVAVLVLAILWLKGAAFVYTPWLHVLLAALFVLQIGIGVPVGFVLATTGMMYVYLTDAAPLVAIAMNAQRGVGGFIFLALPFFILAGFIMDRGGIGSRIVDFLCAVIGHIRGGLLQVLIVGVYIASGISGSKAADMAAIGIPMNRQLKRQGYAPEEAAAVLAASAAMGESVPPSIAILVLGSATSISTGALFIAGLLPAAVIAACLMVLVYLRALMSGRKPVARMPVSVMVKTGRSAIIPLLMPVVLIGGIVGGIGTPTEISSFAVVYGLLLGTVLYRQINLRGFWQLLTDSVSLTGMIFFTFAGATIFSWALALDGVPDAVASALKTLGPSAFLPAAIAITVLLGAVLESVVTIIIIGPLLLPVAIQLGVDPLQYGVVIIEAFGIGSILPPVGLALYIACSICKTSVDRTSKPLVWYLIVLCLGLLLVAFIPWITTVLPHAFNFKS